VVAKANIEYNEIVVVVFVFIFRKKIIKEFNINKFCFVRMIMA
jgi:hypothetical protein